MGEAALTVDGARADGRGGMGLVRHVGATPTSSSLVGFRRKDRRQVLLDVDPVTRREQCNVYAEYAAKLANRLVQHPVVEPDRPVTIVSVRMHDLELVEVRVQAEPPKKNPAGCPHRPETVAEDGADAPVAEDVREFTANIEHGRNAVLRHLNVCGCVEHAAILEIPDNALSHNGIGGCWLPRRTEAEHIQAGQPRSQLARRDPTLAHGRKSVAHRAAHDQ